jgi:hypothetical protein
VSADMVRPRRALGWLGVDVLLDDEELLEDENLLDDRRIAP